MYPPPPLRSTCIQLIALLLIYAILLSFPITAPATVVSQKNNPRLSTARPNVSGVTPAGRSVEKLAHLPMSFEPNVGQADAETRFLSRGSGYTLTFTSREARFQVQKAPRLRSGDFGRNAETERDSFSMRFLGSNALPEIVAEDVLIGKSNYFIGNVPRDWQTDVPNYARVRYKNLYPGIDLVFHGNQRQLEYDFIVGPRADLSAVRLELVGQRNARIEKQGALVLTTRFGEIRHKPPVIYQESDGVRQRISGRYVLRGKQVGFAVDNYDRTKPLVVDPVMLFSSYLGGSLDDLGHGVAVDPFDNIYIVGETSSPNFPTDDAVQSQLRGATNTFVTKINADGTAVLYSTYLGGSQHDRGYAIAVDPAGGVCITGTTGSIDFPTLNPIQGNLIIQFIGGVDAFVARLAPSGSALVFSTYLGGIGFDFGYGIALDPLGNIYVTGDAGDQFPTTTQAFQQTDKGHSEAFITKFNPTGSSILYSTYLGGVDNDAALAIHTDSSQNAYIVGYTESSNDFPLRNPFQATFGGGLSDAFVARIPTAPTPYLVQPETFNAENGGVPASPYSNFSSWTVTQGAVQLATELQTGVGLAVNFDGFPPEPAAIESKTALQVQPGTYRLRFDLFIQGGSSSTSNFTVRLGNLFSETFTAASLNFSSSRLMITRDITVTSATNAKLSFEHTGSIGFGVFLDNVSLFERGAPEYVTFLGGSEDENRIVGTLNAGIKVDNTGRILVTGWTTSVDFPKANAIQLQNGGGADVFVTKLESGGQSLVYSTYVGGSNDEYGNDVAIDAGGNAYVVGNTKSSNFPVKNAIQSVFGGESQFYGDAFALKLSSNGGEMVYSTYLGGPGRETAESAAVDTQGNLLLVGYTNAAFPVSGSQQLPAGGWDAFVTKVTAAFGTGLPDIFTVSPSTAGNSGIVTFELHGDNLQGFSATVRLRRNGMADVTAFRVTMPGPSVILASFDLKDVATGQWDIVAEFSNGITDRISNGVTIVAAGEARISVDLIGPRAVRPGKQRYTIVVRNSGDTDGFGIPVWIKAPRRVEPAIKETLQRPRTPTPIPIDWDTVPQTIEDETNVLIPTIFTSVRARSTRTIQIEVNPPDLQRFNIEAWANPPIAPALTMQMTGLVRLLKCIVDLTVFVIEESLETALPFACFRAIEDYLRDELVDKILSSLGEPDSPIISYAQLILAAISTIATCIVDLVPETKLTKAMLSFFTRAAQITELGAILGDCVSGFIQIFTPSHPNTITVVQSFDPNAKFGSVGSGPEHFVSGKEPLLYAIHFENKATASAPAQTVTITDQLDPNLDLSTINFQTINFGNKRVTPQLTGNGFSMNVDLRPQRNLIVRINGSLNITTRQVIWKFLSLDPATGLPTTNPLEGFLPPNLSPPEGDGSVLFSISPKSGLSSGTVISNQASIVFDDNPAIVTPAWSNQIDNAQPASRVQSLVPVQTSASFVVNWSGNDTGAGIGDYTIYVSDNGGVFTPWLVATTATQASFNSSANHTYSFFSLARDLAGNSESAKSVAEATTQIVGTGTISGAITDSRGNAIPNVTIGLSGSRLGTATTTAAGNYSFTELPGGNYLVTPARFGYTFTPANRAISLTGIQLANFTGSFTPGVPILISEETSTRAIALESVIHLRDPLLPVSPIPWTTDRRTRVMFFTMNLELLAGEPISVVSVDAEDGNHQLHPLIVEFVGRVPETDWLGCVIVRLPDGLGDVGDVLVRLRARGISSNRVRLGIGHSGGGPPDDSGSVPTPGRRP